MCQYVTLLFVSSSDILLSLSDIFQESHRKNDSVIEFHSPELNSSLNQPFKTYIHLDNLVKELKPFDYFPNPSFNEVTKKVITEASIIIVTVSEGPFLMLPL